MNTTPHTALCMEILSTARNDLYLSLRFLDTALSGLVCDVSPLITTSATDGEKLYFQSHFLLHSYDENPVTVNRAYLHNLLHCLFSHLYMEPAENRNLWDLCCDICAESIIDSLDVPCLRKIPSSIREETRQFIEEHQICLYTPGRLYQLFDGSVFYQQHALLMEQDFCIDSHQFWPRTKDEEKNTGQRKQPNSERWRELGDKTRTNMETYERRAGTKAGKLLETLRISYGDTVKYSHFLRRFTIWQDSLRINEEEFDTAYYTLGMELYGSIPLIEPLEYKEEKKIRNLVIAVDTSGSVQGGPVRHFLSETLAILGNTHLFFAHMQIHLLQFDTVVQEDILITSLEQFTRQAESFTIKGSGGTDYRCVFQYIEKMLDTGTQNAIQGLMILTDGYGTYPVSPPPWPTAFLLADFLNKESAYAREPAWDAVPDWAIRQRIDNNYLERSKGTT